MTRPSPPSLTQRHYITIGEYVQASGLSDSTVRRRLRDGSLPKYQPGGHKKLILIPTSALDIVPAASAETQCAPAHALTASPTQAATQASRSNTADLQKRRLPGPSPK